MPAALKNLHVFDLFLLKHLIQLKVNGRFDVPISHDQIFELKGNDSMKFLTLSPEYLIRIWNIGKGLPLNLTLNSLNQLCGILNPEYKWRFFSKKIELIRPSNIPENICFEELSSNQQQTIIALVHSSLNEYTDFNESEYSQMKISYNYQNPRHLDNKSNEILLGFASRIIIELQTRKAGIPIDINIDTVEDIYNSWYALFNEIRNELKNLPKGISTEDNFEVINIAKNILNTALRPHLTLYQAKFRFWMNLQKSNPVNIELTPQIIQQKFPQFDELRQSLLKTQALLIEYQQKLIITLNDLANSS